MTKTLKSPPTREKKRRTASKKDDRDFDDLVRFVRSKLKSPPNWEAFEELRRTSPVAAALNHTPNDD